METPRAPGPKREPSKFGKRLAERLEDLGWTHDQLAAEVRRLGLPCDRFRVSKYVTGERGRRPTWQTVAIYAKALKVKPQWLAGEGDEEAPAKARKRRSP